MSPKGGSGKDIAHRVLQYMSKLKKNANKIDILCRKIKKPADAKRIFL